jgi:hypothetical protein
MQPTSFIYIETDIPAGMTIAEYRRLRTNAAPRRRLRRLLGLWMGR